MRLYDSDTELLDLVRSRLHRGFEAERLPIQLANEFGLAPERVQGIVLRVQAERQTRVKATFRRRLFFGAGMGALLSSLALGRRWDDRFGTLLLVAAIGCGAWLVAWTFSSLLTGHDEDG